MSSAAKIAANQANAQLSTGARTDAGRATSSKNATKFGLFSNNDFIRPGEEALYDELDEGLREDLAPTGYLEQNFVDEIRRVMWRLRRCGNVEAGMVPECVEAGGDPMQFEPTAKLQLSVDRARAQSHRLLLRCATELRKLQTERHIRNETVPEGTDLAGFGLCDLRIVTRAVHEQTSAGIAVSKLGRMETAALYKSAYDPAIPVPLDLTTPVPAAPATPKPVTKPTQTPRNARCTCGSGQKYKRCCGRNAAPLLQAA